MQPQLDTYGHVLSEKPTPEDTFELREQSYFERIGSDTHVHSFFTHTRYSYLPVSVKIPGGLVVRIRRSHRRGRGSIPRLGTYFSCLKVICVVGADM